MKVYVLVENSCGEVRNSLDNVEVFNSKEKAQEALEKRYKELLEDVSGYEFDQNEFDVNYYSVIIQDDDWTIYEGCILEKEVQE